MEMEDGSRLNVKRPKGWGSRHTMGILGFWGFMMLYAVRFNLSIAIVSMSRHQPMDKNESQDLHDLSLNVSKGLTCDHLRSDHKIHLEEIDTLLMEDIDDNNSTDSTAPFVGEGEFDWTAKEKGMILGSFFWGYVITLIPSGMIAHKVGGKWPLGIGLLVAGIASLLTPLAARIHIYALCSIRIISGIGEGFVFPAMHQLLAAWAPPDEKTKLGSIIYAGAQFGTAAVMVLSGYLIHGNVLGGWPSVFYVPGFLTVLWFICWAFFVFDTPKQHPRISSEELNYIETTIGDQASKVKLPTPWRAIFTSMPFWAITVGTVGHAWGLYTLLHELPSYLKDMLHFDIRSNSWLSALPYLLMWAFSIFITQIGDNLIGKGKVRTVVVRKTCQAIGNLGSAILLTAAAFTGCDRAATVTLITLSIGISGGVYGGYTVNHVDIARNHAATMSGMTHFFANLTGFISPYVASLFLSHGNTLENWQMVFFISSAIMIADVIFYTIFASGSEQPWNRGYTSPDKQ